MFKQYPQFANTYGHIVSSCRYDSPNCKTKLKYKTVSSNPQTLAQSIVQTGTSIKQERRTYSQTVEKDRE